MIPVSAAAVTAGHLIAAGFLGLILTGWYFLVEATRKRVARYLAKRAAERRRRSRKAALTAMTPQQRQQEIGMYLLQQALRRGTEPAKEGAGA